MKVIIHPNATGSLVVLYPSGEIPTEEVARKDVPAGVPYIITDSELLPEEYAEFFSAWEADFSNPDGYGIGTEAWFAEQEEKKKQQSLKVLNDLNQPQQS